MTLSKVSQLTVGDCLGPLKVTVDRERLVAYAAASGDHNRIHWDEQFARSVGLPDVIAHGMWTMGAAVEVLSTLMVDPSVVRSYSTKFVAPVVVPPSGVVEIVATGQVKEVTACGVVIELEVRCGQEKVLSRTRVVLASDQEKAGN
ncbi:MaoC/PaaZ C-terminal domain-containing protein [Austwickia chelonae]|uniref:MaoC/PaaZ C-terminal domain-containing protein n=1 Tax=Austwickia chelonae TaxID=100225 RepID=UPI000E21EADE|nr:MaoC/PaaZ C-terminal domain-containing protein [Austwickia chelonae]